MDIESLIHINKTKKNLLKNREEKIKKKIVQVNREKLAHNRPEKQKLSVSIRSRIIQKKDFKTLVEKTKGKEIVLQDNVNAGTFVYRSEKYQRVFERTKQILKIDPEKIKQACQMLFGFAQNKNEEKNLYLRITFEEELKCIPRPVQIEIPHPGVGQRGKSILVTKYGKTKAEEFDQIKHLNIDIYSWSEFQHKLRDQVFKKVALKPTTKLFCDFKIYTKIENSHIFNDIVNRSVIFPIENGKVPMSLRAKFSTYAEYIEDLVNHTYFTTKSQKEYLVRVCKFKQLTIKELSENAYDGSLQIISRLFEKNKQKHNRVSTIELKTDNSICISIYNKA